MCYRYIGVKRHTCVTDTLGLQTHLGYLCKCYILTCVRHYRHTCVTNMFVTQTCLYTDTHEQSLPSNTDNLTGCFHFTSLHFTSLHFTSLHFTSLHFTSLHFTSLHFTSPHFTLLSLKRICILQLMITSKIYGMVTTKCK